MFQQRLQEILQNGYNLDPGKVVSDAFDTVTKKILGISIGFAFIYFLFSMIVSFTASSVAGINYIEMVDIYINAIQSGNQTQLVQYAETIQGSSNLSSILQLLFGIILVPFSFGYLKVVQKTDKMQPVSFGDLFSVYKNPKIAGLILIFIIIYVLSGIALLMCILPFFYVISVLSIAPVLYMLEEDLSFGDALTASFKVGNKNFWPLLGTQILLFLIYGVGYCICGFGALITGPIFIAGQYFIYKQIFNIDNSFNNEIDNIGNTY